MLLTNEDLQIIRRINNKAFGKFDRFSFIVTEDQYNQIKDNDTIIDFIMIAYPIDYILLKKIGSIDFWHETHKKNLRSILTNGIKASGVETSFCEGIYCYQYEIKPRNDEKIIVNGEYTGTYYECLFDRNGTKDKAKETLLEIECLHPDFISGLS